MPRASPAPGEFLDPNAWAANAPAQAALSGLQMLAPNVTSVLTGQPPPALPNFPKIPGKIPSTDDPRIAGAIGEAANLGFNVLPLPPIGLSLAPGRGILSLLRRAAPEAPEALASRSVFLYNPPVKSPRPFVADYPSGAPADAAGQLTADIEGRPLTAKYVVGRRMVGGNDQAFPPAELNPLAEATTGRGIALVPAREIGGDAGRIAIDRFTGRPTLIRMRKDMQPGKAAMVAQHELGHAFDEIAGQIPTRGLLEELKGIYNNLNNPNRAHVDRSEAAPWGKPFTPEALGYKGEEIPREYMVESIRAYMSDPNYLKTVAPKTAAAIREAVNSHPVLSKIIQFNTIAGLAAQNEIDPGSFPIPRQPPPVFSQ